MSKVLIYIRVSSDGQNIARQEEQLMSHHPDKVFVDRISGKSIERPALIQLLDYVRDGDRCIISSMDRLARNVEDLRKIVREITDAGASVQFLKEGLTFTGDDSPMSKLLLNVMGAMAEFERELIKERQREGIAIAKAKGDVYKGRTKCLSPSQVEVLKAQVTAGVPKATVARNLGISRKSLYNYLDNSLS
jgi:DNA invertase Pin-like site-specific DNA recombinase